MCREFLEKNEGVVIHDIASACWGIHFLRLKCVMYLSFIINVNFDHFATFKFLTKAYKDEFFLVLFICCSPVNCKSATSTWVVNYFMRYHTVRGFTFVQAHTCLIFIVRVTINLQNTAIAFWIINRGHCMLSHSGARNNILFRFEDSDMIVESCLMIILEIIFFTLLRPVINDNFLWFHAFERHTLNPVIKIIRRCEHVQALV